MRRIHEARAYGTEPIKEAYWPTTVPDLPIDPSAQGAIGCEFAVIGGGFTGLNAAIALSKSGADVAVFEANQIGWGASGRNGGFCCLGGTKLSTAELMRFYGAQETQTYAKTQRAAVDHVAEMLGTHSIDADCHSDGETLLFHRPHSSEQIDEAVNETKSLFDVDPMVIQKEGLADHGLAGSGFHGAITTPIGFALNPLKYVTGLAATARAQGVRIYGQTTIQKTKPHNAGWLLEADGVRVQARNLIIATNGYSSDDLPTWMAARYLPVPSNVLVTRELTDAEIADQGFWSNQMCYDSRRLLHYFRLMPNKRMLFGMRGATRSTHHEHERTRKIIRTNFENMFPAWQGVETPFYWNGLLAVSRNRVPFVGALAGLNNAYGAMCYHGNGVAMGSYAGKLVADDALGRASTTPRAKFMSATPKKFEFGRFRRATLPLVYKAYGWLDAR